MKGHEPPPGCFGGSHFLSFRLFSSDLSGGLFFRRSCVDPPKVPIVRAHYRKILREGRGVLSVPGSELFVVIVRPHQNLKAGLRDARQPPNRLIGGGLFSVCRDS